MSTIKLNDILKEFQKERNDKFAKGELTVSGLAKLFEPIAKHLICCGHFEVYSGDKLVRKIHPVTVEFYYHDEEDGEGRIKDYIVYHRNSKSNPNLAAFSLGSINAHVSGIDITFEDPEGKYRASALIRAFRVEEVVKSEGLHICLETESRSTYLYEYLFMGIPLDAGIQVKWKGDSESTEMPLYRGYRVNVHKYDLEVKRDKKTFPDDYLDRKGWAFSKLPFKDPWKLDDKEEK